MTARRQVRRRWSDTAGRWVTSVLPLALVLTVPSALRAQTADLRITKTGPSQVASGRTVTYVITTTNLGPATATNVIVRDTLPPTSDFSFVSATRGASRAARRLTWPAITLTSSQTIVDTVVIRATAIVGTSLPNVAIVSANETDPNTADNRSQVLTLVVDVTMIGVAVTPDGADTVRRLPSNGTAYAHAFTVRNTGTVASDFDLLVVAGGAAPFLTVDSITGTGVIRGVRPDSALLSNIGAGTNRTVSVWYRVAGVATGSLDSLILHARSVPIPTVTDSGWVYVRIVRPALLTVKSVAPLGTQAPGTELTYTLGVTNAGSEAAAGVVTVDSLPAEVEFKLGTISAALPPGLTALVEYSADGTDWTYAPISGGCGAAAGYDGCVIRIRWTFQQPLGAVAPDNVATLQFVARIR